MNRTGQTLLDEVGLDRNALTHVGSELVWQTKRSLAPELSAMNTNNRPLTHRREKKQPLSDRLSILDPG